MLRTDEAAGGDRWWTIQELGATNIGLIVWPCIGGLVEYMVGQYVIDSVAL